MALFIAKIQFQDPALGDFGPVPMASMTVTGDGEVTVELDIDPEIEPLPKCGNDESWSELTLVEE